MANNVLPKLNIKNGNKCSRSIEPVASSNCFQIYLVITEANKQDKNIQIVHSISLDKKLKKYSTPSN